MYTFILTDIHRSHRIPHPALSVTGCFSGVRRMPVRPLAMTGKPSGGNGGGNKNFDVLFTRMDHEGIDRFVLLPMDLTTRYGGWVVSNDEIEQIVAAAPNRFIGFASVDPYRPDALEVLDHAFKNQKLAGLKLHPSKQAFYPDDPMMDPIYQKCLEYNKPIMVPCRHVMGTGLPDQIFSSG